jgi:hypothetical protein
MYFVLRFDDQVTAEVQETIVNSVLLRELITHFYYVNEDGTLNIEQFTTDTTDSTLTYAFDQRYPITHATIVSDVLAKDVMYVYLASGSETLSAQATIEGICSMQSVPADATEAMQYAWERIQLDMGELAANLMSNPDRVMVGKIGEVQLLTSFWYGKSQPLETEMIQSYSQLPGEPTDDCTCDNCVCDDKDPINE